MSRDVEVSRQRMLEAQIALLAYSHRHDQKIKSHKQLLEELRNATKEFLNSVERLAKNPPSRLVGD